LPRQQYPAAAFYKLVDDIFLGVMIRPPLNEPTWISGQVPWKWVLTPAAIAGSVAAK
jgi:hypothetical protein